MEYDWLDPQLGHGDGPIFDPSTWTIVHDELEPAGRGADYELYNRKNLHELVHWLQHAGTTWGIFVSLCQLGQSQRIAHWLGKIGPTGRERFFASHEAGKTLIEIDRLTGDFKTRDSILSTVATDSIGHYIALVYADLALRDASRFKSSRVPFGPLVAQAMAIVDGFPWPGEIFEYERHGDDVATADVRTWAEVEQTVTVTDILESAALVNEGLSIGHAFQGDLDSDEFHGSVSDAVRRLFGAEHERYSRAFRVWVGQHRELQELGGEEPDMKNLGRAMISFALLVDAALNPPLPPLYRFDNPGQSLWKDIDPAIRFNLLVTAGAEMWLPEPEIDHDRALQWVVELLERADLPGIHTHLASYQEQEVKLSYDHGDDFSYVESVLLPRFQLLLKLRSVDLLSVAAPGEMVQRESLDAGSLVEEAFQNSFWIPMFLNAEATLISFMPNEAAVRYCESVHVRRALRFAPHRTVERILANSHHRAFADMRPKAEGFESDSLRNWSRQYAAWFED